MTALSQKLNALDALLKPLLAEGLIVAFSGGVDSSYLLVAAHRLAQQMGASAKLVALTTTSASMPSWELDEAKSFAAQLGVEHRVVESHEVEQEAYARNDGTRCYYCKSELFKISWEHAAADGFKHVAYGYNASDQGDYRPGHKAAQEYQIHAPLSDAALTKDDIRQALKQSGYSIADKPASPCLASRVMVGVEVTPQKLKDIQEMEALLRGAGLQVFRVRLHEIADKRMLRIEVAPSEMESTFRLHRELSEEGRKRGYHWVTLDLAGYRMGGGHS